jgi:uncharacterized iron-regulated protein
MTIKTPVRVEDLEGSTPWFGSLVEADGNPLLLSDIAAALNATATAPTSDPSVLRETALVLQQVYEDIVKAADSIDGAMDDLYRQIPDRPAVDAPKDGTP